VIHSSFQRFADGSVEPDIGDLHDFRPALELGVAARVKVVVASIES